MCRDCGCDVRSTNPRHHTGKVTLRVWVRVRVRVDHSSAGPSAQLVCAVIPGCASVSRVPLPVLVPPGPLHRTLQQQLPHRGGRPAAVQSTGTAGQAAQDVRRGVAALQRCVAVPLQVVPVYSPVQALYSASAFHPSNPFYGAEPQRPSSGPFPNQGCPAEQSSGGPGQPPPQHQRHHYPAPHCQGVRSTSSSLASSLTETRLTRRGGRETGCRQRSRAASGGGRQHSRGADRMQAAEQGSVGGADVCCVLAGV